MSGFAGRVGVIQRVLPGYRVPFFDLLAERCKAGLSVFAGEPRPGEALGASQPLLKAKHAPASNLHLFGGALYLCMQGGLEDWLEDWDPDVLIAEANPRYLSTPAALYWMKQRQRPVLGWGLGAPPVGGLFAGARRAQRRRLLSQFDGLIAYSQRGAREYAALGIPAERISVAPNAAAPRPEGAAPKRAAVFAGKTRLLYVGRLQLRKRLDSLLRALARLPKDLQPTLRIVGDGPAKDELKALSARIYPAAEFSGALYGGELEKAFAQADLFVLPGTGGLAVQQALAAGLPAIAAEGDGSQEDMVTPANGWLLPPGDEQALGAALAEALSDPARLRKLGKVSFRLAQEQFNLENMVERFVAALNQVSK